jgi:hypothetical protein
MDGVVDDPRTFAVLFKHFLDFGLQWVGRTRSSDAAGFLTFLIVEAFEAKEGVAALFVTCYDADMRARESLGDWFGDHAVYSSAREEALLQKVLRLAETTSRLTNGKNRAVPLNYCTVNYLYRAKGAPFLRGWHTLKGDVTYLAQVFLENTFDNGEWIKDADHAGYYPSDRIFRMDRTLDRMHDPATVLEWYDTYAVNYSVD